MAGISMGPWTSLDDRFSLKLARLTPGPKTNVRTNSQTGADRRQLPAPTQIRDGILCHAVQNRSTSFCGYKCCPRDCGWQALPCRVRPISLELLRPQFRFLPGSHPTITFFFQDSNPRYLSHLYPFCCVRLSSAPFLFLPLWWGARLTFTHFRIMTITDQGDSDLLNIAETTA